MFGIGNQQSVGASLGQGCAGSGCAPASGAVSGVYNSHAAPHQGAQIGIGTQIGGGWSGIQPGLNPPQQAIALVGGPPVGVAPIGNYMISQSVPTRGSLPRPPPMPQPYQAVVVPTLTPVNNGGRPQVGGNASVVDMGGFWQICENVNMGIFNTVRCRIEPRFR